MPTSESRKNTILTSFAKNLKYTNDQVHENTYEGGQQNDKFCQIPTKSAGSFKGRDHTIRAAALKQKKTSKCEF